MTHSIIQKSQLEGAQRMDAEYYQPEYLIIEKILKNITEKNLLINLANVTTGPAYSSVEMGGKLDIPLARIGDITRKTAIIDWIKLSTKEFQKFHSKALNKFDILMTMTGDPPDVGKCNIYNPENNQIVSYNQRIAKITSNKINAKYLFTYLSTEFARLQCERNALGIRQRNVATDDIRNIKVMIPSTEEQNNINNIIDVYQSELRNSKILYQQAEDLLLRELELKDFSEENDLFSIVNLSETQKANRIDAEYFQEKYEELIEKISFKKFKKLGDLVSMKKGFEPGAEAYQEEGKSFIRVSNLTKLGLNDGNQQYLNEELYNKLKSDFEPQVGEILLSKDATPGIAYVVKEPVEGIISSGILRLKVKEKIISEYLSLVISSLIGQMQAERDAGGSIIAHWKPEQVKSILIPILPNEIQQKIADLVSQSHTARQKSKELLEEAKRKVEEMIEKGGD